MILVRLIGFATVVFALLFAFKGEWGWAILIFLGGTTLGALLNMAIVAGMRGNARDSD